jgi:O-antigen/teichoic acid export membrane protein
MLGLLEGGMCLVFTQKLSISYAKKDLNTFSKLLGSGLFISGFITSILIIAGVSLMPFISHWVKAEPNEYLNIQYAFLLSALGAGFSITFSNISAVFQAWLRVKIHGYTNLISISLGILSTLLGLKFGLGVISIPLGIFVRSFVGVIILLVILINILKKESYPRIRINKENCNDLIKSSIPVFGGNIAKSMITNSQLLIITNFINPASSAIFNITGKIYTVCDSFLAPIGSSIFSSVSQLVGEGNREKIKSNLIRVFILFSIFSAFIISTSFALNHAFICLWLGPDKFGGIVLSALICLNMFLNTRFNFLSINLFALGVFGKTVFYDQIGGILRIILIFTLINHVGYIAIPIAEMLSSIILLGYFINKLIINKLDLDRKEAVKFIFSGSLVMCILFAFSLVWQFYFSVPKNWSVFIGLAFLYITIITVIVFSLTKEIRSIFYNVIAFIKIKKQGLINH